MQTTVQGNVFVLCQTEYRFLFSVFKKQVLFWCDTKLPYYRFPYSRMKVDVELPVLRWIESPAIFGTDHLPVVHYIRYGVYQLGKLFLSGNVAFLKIAFQCLSVFLLPRYRREERVFQSLYPAAVCSKACFL